jgi:hypothetical protein
MTNAITPIKRLLKIFYRIAIVIVVFPIMSVYEYIADETPVSELVRDYSLEKIIKGILEP